MLLPSLASAKDVTVTPATFSGGLTQTVDGVTFTFAKGNGANDPMKSSDTEFRFYGGNTLTVEGNQIQKIVFTVSASYPGNCSATGVTFSTVSTVVTGTVSPASDKIVISNGSSSSQKQMRFSQIVVTVADAGGPIQLNQPAITVGESSFTISSVENGEVYYCVDNSETATAADCTLPYTSEVAFETAPGTYYIHAYAKATDTDAYMDSALVSVAYTVKDPNAVFIEIPVTQTAFNSTTTTYIKEEHEFTYEGATYKTVQINPSTGQVKGNSSPMFYFYNSTPISNVERIELVTSAGTFDVSKIYVAGADAVIGTNPTTGNSGKKVDETIELSLGQPADYFRIWFESGSTSGTCKISKIIIYQKKGSVEPEKKEYTPYFQDMSMMVGDVSSIDLGEEHPDNVVFSVTSGDAVTVEGNAITAVSEGVAVVSATWAEDNVWKASSEPVSFTVTVAPKPTEPQLYNPTFAGQNYIMTIGDAPMSLEFGAKHPVFNYTYTPEGVVSVDAEGNLSALKAGEAAVTVTWPGDEDWIGSEASFKVTVNKKIYTAFSESYSVKEGSTLQLNTGEDAPEITYLVDDESIATISDSGLVTGLKAGSTLVIAGWGDDIWAKGEAEFTITVEEYTQPLVVTFDFTPKAGSYGMTPTNDSNNYDRDLMEFSEQGINAKLQGKRRLWNSNSDTSDLRFYKGDSKGDPGSIQLTAPSGFKFEKIEFTYTGSSKNFECENGIISDDKLTWTPGATFFDNVTFTSAVGTTNVKTITVTLKPEQKVVMPELSLYQLIKVGEGDAYVTYVEESDAAVGVQYDVTVVDGNVTAFTQRPEDAGIVSAYSDNALWTAMVACTTTLPSLPEGAEIKEFAAVQGGTKAAFNQVGDQYVALKDFADLTGFDGEWTASLTAEDNDAIYQGAPADIALTDLYMPVYRIDDVTFDLETVMENVSLTDAKAGEGIHTLENAPVNSLNVIVKLKNPNVVPELLEKLDSKTGDVIISLGNDMATITGFDGSAEKTVSFKGVNPSEWLDDTWKPIANTVEMVPVDKWFTGGIQAVENTEDSKTVQLSAEDTNSLELGTVKYTPVRMKVRNGTDPTNPANHYYQERIYLQKTNLSSALTEATRSTIAGKPLMGDGSEEYVLLTKNGEVVSADYVQVNETWDEVEAEQTGKKHHKLSQLENDKNLIMLAESATKSFWYNGITDDTWISDAEIPELKVEMANIFANKTTYTAQGAAISGNEAPASALLADSNEATHAVLYPAAAITVTKGEIVTAIEEIETGNDWIKVGAGSFEVLDPRVMVYDLNGVMIADHQGRYNVPAGIYLAIYGKQAVKVVVK